VFLLDANVLLYAYDSSSSHHDACRRWLETALAGDEPVGLPWQTLLAFIRIVTNPRAVRFPMSAPQACETVASWLAHPKVVVTESGESFWGTFRLLVDAARVSGPLVTDAALAALALEQGATLVSTDADFLRFEGLRRHDPSR
jgi:uncharacterized protein